MGCNLMDADLRGADLSQAVLEEAILWRADLSDAVLSAARLRATHLERTNLSGVTGLTWGQGEHAFTDEHTVAQLPCAGRGANVGCDVAGVNNVIELKPAVRRSSRAARPAASAEPKKLARPKAAQAGPRQAGVER